MTRLLNANFARLFSGRLFKICAAAAVVPALIESITHAFDINTRVVFPLNPEAALFKSSGYYLLAITAVLVGLFVGAEHGGALRNKIIVGHKRIIIFLANTITCSAAVAIIHFLYVVTILLSGLIFGGKFSLSFSEIALCELLQLASLLEMCVIFSTVSLLIRQKFGGAIVSLVIILVMIALNSSINYFCHQKYSYQGFFQDIPMLLEKRQDISDKELAHIAICESIQDINPFGQQQQIKESFYNEYYRKYRIMGNKDYAIIPIPAEIALYSLGTVAVTTAVGVLVFRKKNIK